MSSSTERVEQAYALAKQRYADLGVDTDRALQRLTQIPISLHCWQGDDVGGFESLTDELGGGLAVTGNYLGKARTPDELRSDFEKAFSLIPGRHRMNLHASYAETGGRKIERNELDPSLFQGWIDWAKEQGLGLDFNPTFFSHPKADDGFTLAHPDKGIRQFWVEHGIACRKIGAAMGEALGSPCVTNVWIPDGYKDTPVDRKTPRQWLKESLDAVFAEPMNPKFVLDAVECKLFGIGSECYVVGSHEFYLGYAIARNKVLCLDAGHFHPTEVISDKIFNTLQTIFGTDTANTIDQIAENFKSMASNIWITLGGILFLIFVSTTLFNVIQQAIHRMWRIRIAPSGTIVDRLRHRGVALIIIVLTGILMLLTAIAETSLELVKNYIADYVPDFVEVISKPAGIVIGLFVYTLWFSGLFRYLPSARMPIKIAFKGGLFTAVLFSLGRFVLGELLVTDRFGAIFGASASILLLMLFIFYSAMLLYLGAAFTFILLKASGKELPTRKNSERYRITTHPGKEPD